VKLDLACGKAKAGADWFGVDAHKFEGVDLVCNLAKTPWVFAVEKEKPIPEGFTLEAGTIVPGDEVHVHLSLQDNSVDEARASHFIEHLEWPERVAFLNELYRVMKKGAKAQLVLPHWCSSRYYGDPTHKSPMSEFAFQYVLKSWRKDNAPHCDAEQVPGPLSYSCDFEATWGYSMHPALVARNNEYQQYALQNFKEAAMDLAVTLTKR